MPAQPHYWESIVKENKSLEAQEGTRAHELAEIVLANNPNKQIKHAWITASGYPALCVWANDSHHCGYVGLNPNHVLVNKDYSESCAVLDDDLENSIEVHGGVTFTGKLDFLENSSLWWVGFDCAHAGDLIKNLLGFGFVAEGYTFKDVDYVVAECEKMAQQLKAIQDSVIDVSKERLTDG